METNEMFSNFDDEVDVTNKTNSTMYGMDVPIFDGYDVAQFYKIKNFMINKIINDSDLYEKCFISKNERGCAMINLRVNVDTIDTNFKVETVLSVRESWYEESNKETFVKKALRNFVNKARLLDYCKFKKMNTAGCEVLNLEIEVLYD